MISLTVLRSLSHLRSSLELLVSKTRVAALVVDLFGTDAFDVAAEFGVAPYIFFTSTAMALSLFLFLPKLDEMVACEFRDMNEPVAIPGCVQVHGSELLDPVQDRRSDAYKCVLNHTKRYRLAEGILVNSFMELEPGPLKALQTLEPVNENGLIDRNEIAQIVKGLMEEEEGKDVRSRMKDLKDAAAKVLSPDGSSTKALATVPIH
ncbi:hypothetical protein AAG906_005248 [Vitis piasezkii]